MLSSGGFIVVLTTVNQIIDQKGILSKFLTVGEPPEALDMRQTVGTKSVGQ